MNVGSPQRLLHGCHPLEALSENTVGVGGDARGNDPPVDPDANSVTARESA